MVAGRTATSRHSVGRPTLAAKYATTGTAARRSPAAKTAPSRSQLRGRKDAETRPAPMPQDTASAGVPRKTSCTPASAPATPIQRSRPVASLRSKASSASTAKTR